MKKVSPLFCNVFSTILKNNKFSRPCFYLVADADFDEKIKRVNTGGLGMRKTPKIVQNRDFFVWPLFYQGLGMQIKLFCAKLRVCFVHVFSNF